MGSDADWEAATEGLRSALEKLGLPYIINEGVFSTGGAR
jgi:threonyl-tRNA synthetase